MSVYGTDPSLVSERLSKTNTGTSIIRVYHGSAAGINNKISTLTEWDQYDIDDSDAPRYVLTVRSPETLTGDASLQWTWEIAATEIQRDIKEHPVILAAANDDAGETALRDVLKAIKDDEKLIFVPGMGAQTPAQTVIFERLYKVMLKGQLYFLWPHYVLRFTATVGPAFTGSIADEGAFRIYTASQIISEFSAFPMYARTQARLLTLQDATPSVIYSAAGVPNVAGYTWGWLKKPMSETQMRDFKIQLCTEWELELWETQLPTYTLL